MASKSASGLNKEQREHFLRDCGFVPVRSGKGSHELWEHPELKMLARTKTIEAPAHLLSNVAQKPWETTLCGNPGGGTWHRMRKHAEWCAEKVAGIKASSENDRRRCELARQFREAAGEVCAWKKSVRNWLKAGLAVEEAPKAPESYQVFSNLKKARLEKPC
jgi:hypothetical protein